MKQKWIRCALLLIAFLFLLNACGSNRVTMQNNNDSFNGDKEIVNVIVKNGVTQINKGCFMGCENLKTVEIPNSVTYIEEYAFASCKSLESITLPDSVEEIGKYAFLGCESLETIRIGSGVIKIDSAFINCPSLSNIIVDDANTVYKSIGNCLIENSSKTLILGCEKSEIPSDGSVIKIKSNAFLSCKTDIIKMTIPSCIEDIGDAFSWFGSVDITFLGTQRQWNAIKKGEYWYKFSHNCTIHCTDGK